MAVIKVLGLDPSKVNFGMARVEIDLTTLAIKPIDISLVVTEKTTVKQVRKNSDDLARARQEWLAMNAWESWADIVMTEVPHGSQSASGAVGQGVCIGLLASINKPLIEIQAHETKLAAVGRKTATKDEMIEWATKLYPQLEWKTHKSKGVTVFNADNEHCADALGVIHAGVKTQQFRAALSMLMAGLRHAA